MIPQLYAGLYLIQPGPKQLPGGLLDYADSLRGLAAALFTLNLIHMKFVLCATAFDNMPHMDTLKQILILNIYSLGIHEIKTQVRCRGK